MRVVTAAGFKLKYTGAAFLVVLLATAAIVALFVFRHQGDLGTLSTVADRAARERFDPELAARAQSVATNAADAIAVALREGDDGALARRLQPFMDDPTVASITVTDPSGKTLLRWRRPARAPAGALSASAAVPVRALTEAIPGAATPRTFASLSVVLEQAAPVSAVSLTRRLQAALGDRERTTLLLALALASAGGLLAAALIWRAAHELARPVAPLIRSAERIGLGDYTRPVEIRGKSALGDLQQALERMRGRLRQSTINKSYLHSVLNSMTDGVIKMANLAACKLLGYAEEELLGRGIVAVLAESERAGFDLLQAAQETRETIVRTRG